MSYQNPRIEILKEMMRLEEQRAGLQSEIDSLVQRLSELRDQLYEGGSQQSSPSTKVKSAGRQTTSARKSPIVRKERGALKEQIISALEAAGSNGIRATDLAKALGTKSANIHAWLHGAKKRYPQITKVETGLYRLEGKIDLPPRPPKPAPASRGKSNGRRKSTAPGSRPGELSARILEELKAVGTEGTSISHLSNKLNVPYRNISVWFSTTGKKNAQVKKVSPAVYRLEA